VVSADEVFAASGWYLRLSEVPEALRYLGEGHAKGKVVITLEHNNKT